MFGPMTASAVYHDDDGTHLYTNADNLKSHSVLLDEDDVRSSTADRFDADGAAAGVGVDKDAV